MWLTWAGAMIMAGTTAAGWSEHQALHTLTVLQPALVPAVLVSLPVLTWVTATGWWLERVSQARRWRQRTAVLAEIPKLANDPMPLRWLRRLPDPLEAISRPVFRTALGRRLAQHWAEAGLGSKPSRYLMATVLAAAAGFLVGTRIAGPVLGVGLGLASPLIPIRWVQARRVARQRQYDDQLPLALDALAAGLAAGLSFQQAIAFAASELPQPMAGVLKRASLRLRLGRALDEALSTLKEDNTQEMMALAVEGIQLQRQFGGDLVGMLNETAGLLRERLELEREVQAVTSQGRLSGAVVAGLVPVSAGLLLLTNPRYIDVLFDTLIGQLLLVAAMALQLVGWAILSGLVRIRY